MFIETGPCFCFGDTLEHLVSCRSETELRLILTLIKGELRWKWQFGLRLFTFMSVQTRRLLLFLWTRKKKCKKIYTGCSFEVIWGRMMSKLQMIKGRSVWFVLYYESSEAYDETKIFPFALALKSHSPYSNGSFGEIWELCFFVNCRNIYNICCNYLVLLLLGIECKWFTQLY